jgi:hypothetical protein
VLGEDLGYYLTYARHRVEAAGSRLVGLTYQTATIDPAGTILSLTIIDKQHAEPGTAVSVASAPRSRRRPATRTRGRNTGAPNRAWLLLW